MSPMVRSKRRSEARIAPNAELARLVQGARIHAGLSTADVARYLEISVETMQAYESQAREIPLNHIYGLSNLLDIPPADILRVAARVAPVKRVRA